MDHLLYRGLAALVFLAGLVLSPCVSRAAITHVGTDKAVTNASAASFTLTLAQAPTQNDTVAVAITFAHNPEVITGPAGYVEQYHSDSNGCSVWTHPVGAAEAAAQGTFSLTSANTTTQVTASEWAGVSLTIPIDGSSASPASPWTGAKAICNTYSSAIVDAVTTVLSPTNFGIGADQPVVHFGSTDTIAARCACTPKTAWTEGAVTASGSIAETQHRNSPPTAATSGEYRLTTAGTVTLRSAFFLLAPAAPTGVCTLALLGVGMC